MNTNKHKWEPLLYSGLGVAAMFLILVAIGVIAGAAKVRLDLTADRVYTLSEGTKQDPGQARYAASQSTSTAPSPRTRCPSR